MSCFLEGSRQAFALFDDNLGAGSLVCLDQLVASHAAYTLAEAETVFQSIEAARSQGWWTVLAAHYEFGAALEPSLRPLAQSSSPALLLQAWVFARKTHYEGTAAEQWWQEQLALLTPQEREAGILSHVPAWDEDQHADAVRQILDWITKGDCYQVNLTFPIEGQAYGHPLALFARLREAQPVTQGALIHDGQNWILSRSPELFIGRTGTTLTCRPMKGTAPRHADPQQDAANAAELLASRKEQAENIMIVDLIRNDLGRLAPPGGVETTRLLELESYRTVFQLTSTVQASPVHADLATVFRAVYPCGSITGAPKIRAMQIIHDLESGPRGLYCGALGWVAPDGDFSFTVPIRTLLMDANRHYRLNVGSGIVADSRPAAEYRECLRKAHFATALGDTLQLIETLRWESSTGYPLLPFHLERLQRSAQALGFKFDAVAVTHAVAALAETFANSPRRVRLTLSRQGELQLEHAELGARAGPQRIGLAAFKLFSRDPRLSHKTTARAFYDNALSSAIQAGLFDVIFCNERNELCEGARSNLFLEFDEGPLLTPASSSGLLPGVMRAQLIADGRAQEAVLPAETLHQARRIWVGNALRGLLEVKLAGSDAP